MSHRHEFNENQWPFDTPVDSPAYSTRNIIRNGHPILTVAHDSDGDWQFIGRSIESSDEMSIVCLGCLLDRHPWIAEFRDLPRGWMASRENEDAEWIREAFDEE